MPLTVNAAARLMDQTALNNLAIGERLDSVGKAVRLSEEDTRVSWLADRSVCSRFLPYRFAFSLGDVCAAAATFWLLPVGLPVLTGTTTLGEI